MISLIISVMFSFLGVSKKVSLKLSFAMCLLEVKLNIVSFNVVEFNSNLSFSNDLLLNFWIKYQYYLSVILYCNQNQITVEKYLNINHFLLEVLSVIQHILGNC